VIGTEYIGSCKSNYHTITTTMAPVFDCCLMPNEQFLSGENKIY